MARAAAAPRAFLERLKIQDSGTRSSRDAYLRSVKDHDLNPQSLKQLGGDVASMAVAMHLPFDVAFGKIRQRGIAALVSRQLMNVKLVPQSAFSPSSFGWMTNPSEARNLTSKQFLELQSRLLGVEPVALSDTTPVSGLTLTQAGAFAMVRVGFIDAKKGGNWMVPDWGVQDVILTKAKEETLSKVAQGLAAICNRNPLLTDLIAATTLERLGA